MSLTAAGVLLLTTPAVNLDEMRAYKFCLDCCALALAAGTQVRSWASFRRACSLEARFDSGVYVVLSATSSSEAAVSLDLFDVLAGGIPKRISTITGAPRSPARYP